MTAIDLPSDLSPQQRAALAVLLLLDRPMTTAEIAERCGLSTRGARAMLGRISRIWPLYVDAGRWTMLAPDCEQ